MSTTEDGAVSTTPGGEGSTAPTPEKRPGLIVGLVLALTLWVNRRLYLGKLFGWMRNVSNHFYLQLPVSHTENYKLRIIWYYYPFYSLGTISFVSFMIATVTGIVLAFWYVPSAAPVFIQGEAATEAWRSVAVTIMQDVPLGFLMRAMHFWSSMIMVAAVIMHMFRVYFTQGYKRPREFNWVIGVVLLVLSMALGYTGYLLPWSQLSYWAGTIGIEMSLATPIVGEMQAALIFGGTTLGQGTITRMYILHVFVLPVIAFFTMIVHMFTVWYQGMAEPH